MTRFRKALALLLIGCASTLACAQAVVPVGEPRNVAAEPQAPDEGTRPAALASTGRQRRRQLARIFGAGTRTARGGPEPLRPRRGHKSIDDANEVPMATAKQATPPKSAAQHTPQVKPMPFPGESPTVSLALAAGRQYGPQEQAEQPARSRKAARSRPKKASSKKTGSKKAASRKKSART